MRPILIAICIVSALLIQCAFADKYSAGGDDYKKEEYKKEDYKKDDYKKDDYKKDDYNGNGGNGGNGGGNGGNGGGNGGNGGGNGGNGGGNGGNGGGNGQGQAGGNGQGQAGGNGQGGQDGGNGGGMGGMGGMGMGGMGGMGMGGMMGRRKRSINMDTILEHIKLMWGQFSTEKTMCMYSSKMSKLICEGFVNLACDIEQVFTKLDNFTLCASDIWVDKPAKLPVDKYQLISALPKHLMKLFNFEAKEQKLPLWFYHSVDIKENGFLIKDEKCWKSFEDMIKMSSEHHVTFYLDLMHPMPLMA